MTHDKLKARLREKIGQGSFIDGLPYNPDGFEAADAIERLEVEVALVTNERSRMIDRYERLEAENARLREAGNKLADAAYHGEECPMNTTGAYCNCGYDAAAEAWCTALEKTS